MDAFTPYELACASGLLVVRRPDLQGLTRVPGALLIGAGTTDGELATVAVRDGLAQRGCVDEGAVRAMVEQHGYDYVPA